MFYLNINYGCIVKKAREEFGIEIADFFYFNNKAKIDKGHTYLVQGYDSIR